MYLIRFIYNIASQIIVKIAKSLLCFEINFYVSSLFNDIRRYHSDDRHDLFDIEDNNNNNERSWKIFTREKSCNWSKEKLYTLQLAYTTCCKSLELKFHR